MTVLLAASPSFAENWNAFRDEWAGEHDMPLYLALSDFAQHTIRFLETMDTERLNRIFDAIEILHLDGDSYVREAATIGLLEDLQNRNLHRSTDPEQFRPFLRTESLKWWDRLNRFWDGDTDPSQDEPSRGPAAG